MFFIQIALASLLKHNIKKSKLLASVEAVQLEQQINIPIYKLLMCDCEI